MVGTFDVDLLRAFARTRGNQMCWDSLCYVRLKPHLCYLRLCEQSEAIERVGILCSLIAALVTLARNDTWNLL